MERQGDLKHRRARWILAVLLSAALVIGLLLGQAQQLFAYAWPLCLPCIGIQ
jgi:hypothetical protein